MEGASSYPGIEKFGFTVRSGMTVFRFLTPWCLSKRLRSQLPSTNTLSSPHCSPPDTMMTDMNRQLVNPLFCCPQFAVMVFVRRRSCAPPVQPTVVNAPCPHPLRSPSDCLSACCASASYWRLRYVTRNPEKYSDNVKTLIELIHKCVLCSGWGTRNRSCCGTRAGSSTMLR